jgi:AraC-like DNA-binding protein
LKIDPENDNNLILSMSKKQNIQKNCFCQKDSGGPVAMVREFKKGTKGAVNILQQEILFMIRGGGRITIEDTEIGRTLRQGEFVFLPAGIRLACDFEQDTTILLVRIIVDHPECHALRVDKPTGHQEIPPSEIYALKINKRMQNFTEELLESLADGHQCRLYMQAEVGRMLFLLHSYYPMQERVDFFSHILTPDIKFSEFVRMNHTKYKTVGEMAEALFMTTQAFSNRFKKVFGMPPHRWMQREKARKIYLDICRNDMPLKEIVVKYDFPLSSNFFRFCKQTFGDTPGNIRKKLHGSTARRGGGSPKTQKNQSL